MWRQFFFKSFFGKPQLVLIVCSIVSLIANIDITITNVALSTIAHKFSVDILATKNTIIGFLVAYAISIPLVEFMVDRFGLKTMLLLSCCLFALSSFLCATSNNIDQLILYRIFQGLSAGFFTPIARSVVVRVSDKNALAINLSNVQTLGMLGQAIGPFVGSYIVRLLGWPYVFYLNIPLCIIALFLTSISFDAKIFNKKSTYQLDYKGYTLIATATVALFFLLNDLQNSLHYSKNIWLKALAILIAFYALSRHISNYKGKQILNFGLLFSNKTLKHSLWISLIARQFTGVMQFFIVIAFHHLHYTEMALGYLLLSYGLGIWSSKILVKYIFSKVNVVKIIQYTLALLFILNVVLLSILSKHHNFFLSATLMFFLGTVISIFHSALNVYSYTSVSKTDAISTSSFTSLLVYICQSSSIALYSIMICWCKPFGSNKYLLAEFVLSLSLVYVLVISSDKLVNSLALNKAIGKPLKVKNSMEKQIKQPSSTV